MSSFRNFILTFLIFLLLFSVAAYPAIKMVDEIMGHKDKKIANDDEATAIVVDEDQLAASDSFTMLFVGLDKTKDNPGAFESADAIFVMRFSKETGKVVFIPIPSNTQVEDGSTTINRAYSEKGINDLCEKITGLTSLTVDYFAVIDLDNFEDAIDKLDGVDFSIPIDMEYEDKSQDLVIDIKKGYQNLDGQDAAKALRYLGGDSYARMERTISMAKILFEEYTKKDHFDEALELYDDLIDEVTTNFTEAEFKKHLDIIYSYPTMQVMVIDYPGEDTGTEDNAQFIPNKSAAYDLFDEFKLTVS
ncbi:MAG: LCP family protein [Clostridia bacterium]|nr:LCP family protein [Clostridia bacterium]